MAMPSQVPDLDWTVERALALPDDGMRYEVLDGELFVTPSPTWGHQSAIEALILRVAPYVRHHGLGWARCAPADITFSARRLVQPDLFVVPARTEGPPASWEQVKALLLVVEVISPSTARADRYRKRTIYQSESVGEYWIIDAGQRLIERWRPGDVEPEIVTETLEWVPREGVEPLVVRLTEFFDEIVR